MARRPPVPTVTWATSCKSYSLARCKSSRLTVFSDPRVDSDMDGSRNMGASRTGTTGTTDTTTGKKPSLLDRLNPMKDSDHDGKKGFND